VDASNLAEVYGNLHTAEPQTVKTTAQLRGGGPIGLVCFWGAFPPSLAGEGLDFAGGYNPRQYTREVARRLAIDEPQQSQAALAHDAVPFRLETLAFRVYLWPSATSVDERLVFIVTVGRLLGC
jgi:hypothetical protein